MGSSSETHLADGPSTRYTSAVSDQCNHPDNSGHFVGLLLADGNYCSQGVPEKQRAALTEDCLREQLSLELRKIGTGSPCFCYQVRKRITPRDSACVGGCMVSCNAVVYSCRQPAEGNAINAPTRQQAWRAWQDCKDCEWRCPVLRMTVVVAQVPAAGPALEKVYQEAGQPCMNSLNDRPLPYAYEIGRSAKSSKCGRHRPRRACMC